MATVSFNMRREIRNDSDADRFMEALDKSTCFVVKKADLLFCPCRKYTGSVILLWIKERKRMK